MFSSSQQSELQRSADILASFSPHPCGFRHELRRGQEFCSQDVRRRRLGCAHWHIGDALTVIGTLSSLGVLSPDESSIITHAFEKTDDELNELDQFASVQALSQGEVGYSAKEGQRGVIAVRMQCVERMLALLAENGVLPRDEKS